MDELALFGKETNLSCPCCGKPLYFLDAKILYCPWGSTCGLPKMNDGASGETPEIALEKLKGIYEKEQYELLNQ